MCCRGRSSGWPHIRAALSYHKALWSQLWPMAAPDWQHLQLIGFEKSSGHANLQAEFACAFADEEADSQHKPRAAIRKVSKAKGSVTDAVNAAPKGATAGTGRGRRQAAQVLLQWQPLLLAP
eukprot:jgi/Chrzof1/12003/Cz06g17220.t1